jgi:hypothetical protein
MCRILMRALRVRLKATPSTAESATATAASAWIV